MSVNIYKKIKLKDYEFDISYRKIANKIVKECCLFFNLDYKNFDVDISIVDNKTIKQINNSFRNINKETDVLSFPYFEFKINGGMPEMTDDKSINNELLGEIIISVEKCISQAKEYGHSVEREWAFLITHSMLHLFGFDHMNKQDEKIMFEIQDIILNEAKINRI